MSAGNEMVTEEAYQSGFIRYTEREYNMATTTAAARSNAVCAILLSAGLR